MSARAKVPARQYLATARFHERMARAFQEAGRADDAAAARRAAEAARASARRQSR